MANESLALSGFTAELPADAEYDAVYAAVTATERGRWFLTEYANRNRRADTDLVVGAIARIEAAILGDSVAKEPVGGPDIGAAAERIADIAFDLRERAADPRLCDALDAAVREICEVCAGPHTARQAEGGADRGIEDDSDAAPFEFELQDGKKFAAAAAALGASLTALGEELQTNGETPSESAAAVAPPPQDHEAAPEPRISAAANGASRSYIAPPDFVFHSPEPDDKGGDVESSDRPGQAHALLPGAELLVDPEDDPGDLFELASINAGPPLPQAPLTVAATPMPAAVSDPAQPQLRAVTASATRPTPRPMPSDPLAALRALSEQELMALFG